MNGTAKIIFLLAAALILLSQDGLAKPKRTVERPARPPEFFPRGGVFTNDVTVRLTTDTPRAVIRFTLDGTAPTATSAVYGAALTLTNCSLVRARLFVPEGAPGDIASHQYTLLDPALADFNSNLPLLIINTWNQEILAEAKSSVSTRVIDTQGGRSRLTGPAEYDGFALLDYRGRASLRYSKRSFNLRTVGEFDEPEKAPLLGFPKDSDWVCYSSHADKTLMRDVLAYEWSNAMGRYAPRTKYVEVFLHESGPRVTPADYHGIYVLTEKIKVGKHRVNIAELAPEALSEPAVSGGYMFKKEHSDRPYLGTPSLAGQAPQAGSTNRPGYPTGPGGFPGDPAGFLPPYDGPIRETTSSISRTRTSRTSSITNRVGVPPGRDARSRSLSYNYEDEDDDNSVKMEYVRPAISTNQFYLAAPAPDVMNGVQRAWLRGYLEKFEAALYGPDFTDPVAGYSAYIDPGSFIDHHLLVESTKNVDGFRFSAFYHKDRGGKIHMGPIWDWNLSMGNVNGKQGWLPEYWYWPQLDDQQYPWFRRLFDDPDFGQSYVDRWAEVRKSVFASSRVLARIDEISEFLTEARERNFKRWPLLGLYVHPHMYTFDTYAEDLNYLKQFLTNRLDWIDRQLVAAPQFSSTPDRLEPGRPVTLTVPAGEILFTLDGADPRAPGGRPAPGATAYRAPVSLRGKQEIFARARVDNRWSAPARLRPH